MAFELPAMTFPQPTNPCRLSDVNLWPNFVAIDFETASNTADSACAVGVVRVEEGRVVDSWSSLIKAPYDVYMFTEIHGIRAEDCKDAPTFGEIWPRIEESVRDIEFVAAHNASFDRRVLLGGCAKFGIEPPSLNFLCTVELARSAWKIFPTKLPNVSRHLGITLNHHEAMSDASACAEIVRRAHLDGELLRFIDMRLRTRADRVLR
jgi:DNA polymerase-3 subunit epsilon